MKWVLISICLVIFDQIAKYIIKTNLVLHQSVQILPVLAISYTTNTGTVFGLFQGKNEIFVIIISLILALLVLSSKNIIKEYGMAGKVALCLIFSGGIGNLIDRIFFGKVVDFIDLQWNYKNIWPVFNFADSYVFIGIWILIIKNFVILIKSGTDKVRREN